MRKTIFFWLYFVVAIVLAVYFSTRVITSLMGRGPISSVKEVHIVSQNDIDKERMKIALGLTKGTLLKSVDIKQINKRIQDIPYVENSAIQLSPNGDINIKIQQYEIVGHWTDGNKYYPISDTGVIIENPLDTKQPNTIVFRGNGLPDNLNPIINATSSLSEYIDSIQRIESRRWNIYTTNGTTVYLPEDKAIDAINKLILLNQTHQILSRQIDIIDMRDNKRILVKLKK